jgi:sortase A
LPGSSNRKFHWQIPSREGLRRLRASGQERLHRVAGSLRVPEARRWASLGLMFTGVALLLYVSSQYLLMYAEQRNLEHEWAEQNTSSASHLTQQRPNVVDDGLTRVSIPKIKLDAIVVEGTGHRQLLLGPGHMPDTPLPGEAGNSVLTGHRDTFFRHIYELRKGDQIEIRRRGRLYTYEVTGKKVVKPEDLSVLAQGRDHRLTLITCYPTYYIGPAPDRLVVFAELANTPAAAHVVHATAGQGR